MKGTMVAEARAKVAAEALELARDYLAGLSKVDGRRAAIGFRKTGSRHPLIDAVACAFCGAPSGWSPDLAADAEARDPIALAAVLEASSEAIANGEPVPAPYRDLAARALAEGAPAPRRGRTWVNEFRDIHLALAVYRLTEQDGFRKAVALEAVATAAGEHRVGLTAKAIETIFDRFAARDK